MLDTPFPLPLAHLRPLPSSSRTFLAPLLSSPERSRAISTAPAGLTPASSAPVDSAATIQRAPSSPAAHPLYTSLRTSRSPSPPSPPSSDEPALGDYFPSICLTDHELPCYDLCLETCERPASSPDPVDVTLTPWTPSSPVSCASFETLPYVRYSSVSQSGQNADLCLATLQQDPRVRDQSSRPRGVGRTLRPTGRDALVDSQVLPGQHRRRTLRGVRRVGRRRGDVDAPGRLLRRVDARLVEVVRSRTRHVHARSSGETRLS